MKMTKESSHRGLSANLESLRDRVGKGLGSASEVLPLSEAEQKLLFRVMPDQILRISLEHNGYVSVIGQHNRIHISAKSPPCSDDQLSGEKQPADPMKGLYEELGRHGKRLMVDFQRTGEVQVFELQLDHDGQTTFHEVRAAACDSRELLAVVRDVTLVRDTENALARSTDELTRLNELLGSETSLRAREEEAVENGDAKLQNLLRSFIEAMSLIVRMKDPQTASHQERVSQLACAIAQEMGLETSQVNVIGLAALLHDLGMIFVPDAIILRPGKLTGNEYAKVKNHPEAVFQILKSNDLFRPIAEIVHQHHERLDGSGYPQGLTGDSILMEARVVAVADVAEAILTDRPYRPALGLKMAMSEIEHKKGTLYDAQAVNACTRLFREGRFKFNMVASDLASEIDSSGV